MSTKNALPDIRTNFPAWYQEVVYKAELADESPVRGTMIVCPYGYALWELIKGRLDTRIKETGHKNAAFPLFIPESYFRREAEHVEGFAPELAVVTHAGGKELEEPLVVRPTSETIIHASFARWIKSWRDLPLLINQWANVVRWEKRPRPFLRTTEFFWQEGHTAHETEKEARDEVALMLKEYVDLAQGYLAIPVVTGQKTASEKFPGAIETYTFEGLMQDGKALQMGTSHWLSQDFAKVADMKFQDRDGNLDYPHMTSWGTTTRLVGAVVMVHGDEAGLILPPKVAPIQVVIIPILKKNADNSAVAAEVAHLKTVLHKAGIRVEVDADDSKTPGAKFYHWELRGVPVRIELGPRDLEKRIAMVSDRLGMGKQEVPLNGIDTAILDLLERIQQEMFKRALDRRNAMWFKEAKLAQFGPMLDERPGFYQSGWCGSAECEAEIKNYKATTRCVLNEVTFPECFHCSRKNIHDVLIAKAY